MKIKNVVSDIFVTLYRLIIAIWDLMIIKLKISRKNDQITFGFLIHDRDGRDVYRWLPALKYLPESIVDKIRWWMWPARTGIVSVNIDGKSEPVKGYLIATILTAKQMIENHNNLRKARNKIDLAFCLADNLGLKVMGLGAYTASVTRLGEKISKRDIPGACLPTSGHSYTSRAIIENLIFASKYLETPLSNLKISIIGVGSIGSACTNALAGKPARLLLVDRSEKQINRCVGNLPSSLKETILASTNIDDVSDSDIIIAATTSPESILKPGQLKNVKIVIDDSQPRNIDHETARISSTLVIDGARIFHKTFMSTFQFGLNSNMLWGCLAETIIIASTNNYSLITVGPVDTEISEKLFQIGNELGFEIKHLSFDSPICSKTSTQRAI
jgi:predicted amino acid dehydrogenase